MGNVVEILVQAKGGEQVEQTFGKADQVIAGLKAQFADLRARMDALTPSTRAAAAALDQLPKPRQIHLDSADLERMKTRVKELETALEPSRIQARIRAMERELSGLGKGKQLGLGDLDVTSIQGFAASIGRVAGAAAVGIGALTAFAAAEKSVIGAAAEAELAQVKFAQAIAVTGQYSAANVARMQEFAGGLQRVTTQTDEAVMSAAALIAQIGGLSGGVLERATAAAVNLSAILGTDLQSSALMVARAATGATQGLERLVGQIKEGATPAETFANVLQRLEALGQPAIAQADTLTGSLIKLKNTFGEVGEAIGRTQLSAFTQAVAAANEVLSKYLSLISPGTAPTLAAEIDRMDHFLVRFADNARKAGEALQVFQQSDAGKNLQLLVEHGKVDEARGALLLLQAELDRIRSRPATEVTVDVAHQIQQQLDSLKAKFSARLDLDTTLAAKDLDAFGAQFKPKDLVAKVTVNSQAVREALDALGSAGVTISPVIDLAAARAQIESQKAGLRDLATIRADMKIEISRASVEELTAQKAALEARLQAQQAAVVASPNDQTARRALEQTIALVQQFNALSPARLSFLVDDKAIGQLESIRRSIEDTVRAASGNALSIVSAEDLARSRSLGEEMARDRAALQALLDAGKGAQASTALNGMLVALAEMGRQMPERLQQIQAFAAQLRQEFTARISIQIDQSDAESRLRNTKSILEDLSKIAPGKLEAFDTSQLVRSAESAQEAIRGFDATLTHALTGHDAGQIVGVMQAIDTALNKIETAADPVDASLIAFLATARDDARRAAGALADLGNAADIRKRIDLAISDKDIVRARAGLEALKVLAAQFPDDLTLQVQLKGAEQAVANLGKLKAGALTQAQQMTQSISATVSNGLGSLLTVPFAKALGETRSFAEQMQSILGDLVRSLLGIFAKIGLGALFPPLLPFLSTTPAPSETQKATAGTGAPPPPLPVPVRSVVPRIEVPRVEVSPLAAITMAPPSVTVSDLAAVTLAPPEVRIPDLAAVVVPPPEILAPGPAIISVALDVGPLAPLAVDPPRVALTSRIKDIVAPAPRVAPLKPVSMAAPELRIAAVRPVPVAPELQAIQPPPIRPEVTVGRLAPVRLAAPDLDVAPPSEVRIPAPTLQPPPPAAVRLPGPSVTMDQPEIVVPGPIVSVAPRAQRPLTVQPPPFVVPPVRTAPRIQAARIPVQAPAFDVRGKTPELFSFDAPEFRVASGIPDAFEVAAPEFTMGPVGAIAPVRLDVPVVTAQARAPRLAPISIQVPRPNVSTQRLAPIAVQIPRPTVRVPRIEAPAIEAPRLAAPEVIVPDLAPVSIDVPRPLFNLPRVDAPTVVVPKMNPITVRVPDPILQEPKAQRLAIAAPVVDLPKVALPTVRVGTPPRASVSVPAPRVSFAAPIVSLRAPDVSGPAPIVPRGTPPALRTAVPASLGSRGAIAPPNAVRSLGSGPSSAPVFTGAPELTRALGRLTAPPAIQTRRAVSATAALDFARNAPRFAPARLPGFDGRPREDAAGRVSRFFFGAQSTKQLRLDMNINALDAGSIEREARPGGNIHRAMTALARSRRE